ncbi:Transporter aclS [Pseudocercospora fuligena]|uniref:Transporter aclS n=1 Tax=Pseudocercospora fuligena TaxID=685502 RepID=A0A8H6VL69_9PEZI|nr:Transporter aclS [Pseudocercospora fuligena]
MVFSDETKRKARYWAKRLECPVDENAGYHNTYWCNRDLIPIPPDRQTYSWQDFAGYWVIAGINTTAWTSGSSLLALGLSVPQAMGLMVGVSLISALIAVVAGWPGSHQHLGFTVLCRASWGMRGGFWPVLNRIMTAIIWLGIQLYWGGQSVKIILGAIIGPKFVFMENTLPASANVDTASLIGFFVFLVLFLPFLMVPPEKLIIPLRITFVTMTCTLFGILGWAIGANGGAGPLINTPSTAKGSTLSWAAVYGLQSIIGSQASGCLGQSDWTRYARTPNAALFGQLITAPLTITITAICGLLITSATAEMYGTYLWNPFELLLHVQQTSLTPKARAGTFFAGLGFFCSQVMLCVILNAVSAGMDLAALCPKWINIRRGTYFLSIIAVAICPWQYVSRPTTFINVLSGWSVFLSPMTGIVVSDYFLVRGREYHIGDLYTANVTSAYWGIHGFNWRGFLAWTMGIWPVLPGFARSIQGTKTGNGWDHIYDITYFYGFFVALFVYWAAHAAFPQPRQQGSSPFVLQDHAEMLEGSDASSQEEAEMMGVEPKKSTV